ncbi:hypothetical protein BDZ89DRAFT_1075190 [Hymenopellis radicata]|nr:hypothetical protein BDZ89DRAFT_1075190 [Hymenopellis radicata]
MDRLRSVFKRSPRHKIVRRSVSMTLPVEWPAHLDIIDIRAGAEARSIEDLTSIFPPPPRTPPRPRSTSGSTSTTIVAPTPRAFVYVHPIQHQVKRKSSLDAPRQRAESDRPRRTITLKASFQYLRRSASKCSIAKEMQRPTVTKAKVTKTQQRQYSRFSKPLPPIPTFED